MLVLSRKIHEKLILDDDTVITVLGVRGNCVRMGIDAPRSIKVHREEIYQKIKNAETHCLSNEEKPRSAHANDRLKNKTRR